MLRGGVADDDAGDGVMTVQPIELYDGALAADIDDATMGLSVRYADGRVLPMDVPRWRGVTDAADDELLRRCLDPTLDVGCGPGRLVAALCAAGGVALGVDVAPKAVDLARGAGAQVVRRSVFDPLPAEAAWRSVLLADGNIGIGGDPARLLRRCRDLLTPDGQVLVELDRPGSFSDSVTIRLESAGTHSEWFSWAHVSSDLADAPAAAAGLRVIERWTMEGRWFACLAR
jgi:SAM-dependent methyltransferase